MSYPLAIFTTDLGAPSETFIRRHVRDLFPGKTTALTYRVWRPDERDWEANGPVLEFEYLQDSIIKEFLIQHGTRLLLGEYLNESLPFLKIVRDLGMKFYAHAHGYDVSQYLRDPYWRAEYLKYNESDGIITMSELSRERLVEVGIKRDLVHVIPYGVDVPAEPLQRPERPVRCLAVGRMVAKKAPQLTVQAFHHAAQVCPELKLDMVGTGPLFPAVQELVRNLNLSDKVRLLGWQRNQDVLRLMKESDLFLQHSRTDPETGDEEGLPVAILEAMANALPVVSTHHAAIPEAVHDGSTGFLVREGDAKSMGARIVELTQDATIRKRMGEAGWLRAKQNFSWEREQKELLKVLEL